jgi:hypothetical protein
MVADLGEIYDEGKRHFHPQDLEAIQKHLLGTHLRVERMKPNPCGVCFPIVSDRISQPEVFLDRFLKGWQELAMSGKTYV